MGLQRGLTLEEGATVLDIGAHIGLFALFVAAQLEQFDMFCVEPSKESSEALRGNLELHCPAARVMVDSVEIPLDNT